MKEQLGNFPRISVTMKMFFLLFFGVMAWVTFADLDYGVHAEGQIANLRPSTPIQHDSTARVEKIHVKEGEFVEKGQPLLTLDQSMALAESLAAQVQALQLRLQLDAALAERKGSGNLPKPGVLSRGLPEELVNQSHRDAELALRQRIESNRAQLNFFASEQAVAKAQIESFEKQARAVDSQIQMLSRQVRSLEPMEREGLIARVTLEDKKARLEDFTSNLASMSAEIERARGLEIQSEARQRAFLADWRNTLEKRISELAPQVESAEKQALASAIRLKRYVVLAPEDGQVINVKLNTQNEVVRPSETLMELIPADRQFYVDARVTPAEIEAVQPGKPAEVHFLTLPSKSTPRVDGTLLSIASKATMDEKTGQSYYIARVGFTGDVVKEIGMEPVLGMPVEVLIKGGKRSVLSYLIDPFTVLFMKAMKEK